MRSILEHCAAARRERLEPGAILLEEQERTGRLFVLIEGHVEVLRGNTQIALIKEPGSIFGEMSISSAHGDGQGAISGRGSYI